MLVPYARKNHTVSNFNPFHDFDELERAFFSDNALSEFKTDIQEDGDNFVLEADLPGFKKEDIHVDVADDRLTVTAERHSNFEDKDKKNKYVRCERSYGTYARSFDISGIDAKAIKAAYSDGVLRVTLPKQKEVPARPDGWRSNDRQVQRVLRHRRRTLFLWKPAPRTQTACGAFYLVLILPRSRGNLPSRRLPRTCSGCRPRQCGGWARCRWRRWSRRDDPAGPRG